MKQCFSVCKREKVPHERIREGNILPGNGGRSRDALVHRPRRDPFENRDGTTLSRWELPRDCGVAENGHCHTDTVGEGNEQ